MQEKQLFEYAIIRVVPRVEREEFLNVGVIIYCPGKKFLKAIITLDEERLCAFKGQIDIREIRVNLHAYEEIAKGSASSEIQLGAFNVPPGSVTVSAGGQVLQENVDYTIDYNLGTVKVINSAIISSGVPVNVQFENNAGFGIQQRNFLGLRLDYLAKQTAREALTVGASMVKLSERPFFTKTGYNEDPIKNTMYGLDFSYRTESQWLTRWLDKLPFFYY